MRKFTKDPEAIKRLTPEQYRVTQESGTERPGTGELLDNHEPGIYVDIVSGEPLFASLRFVHRDDMEAEGYGEYLDQVQ